MIRWYALHTKPRLEFHVEDLLTDEGIETYLPRTTRRSARTGKHSETAFFPRYIFVHVDLSEVALSYLQWLPGVTKLVSFGGGYPSHIPDRIVGIIRDRMSEIQRVGGLAAWRFRKGEIVRVTSGPFEDIEGVFDSALRSGDRVRLLLDLLGRVCTVEVDADSVEATGAKRLRRTRGRGRVIHYRSLNVAGVDPEAALSEA